MKLNIIIKFLKKNKNIIYILFGIIIIFLFYKYYNNIEFFENENENNVIPKKIYQTHKSKEEIEKNPKLVDSVKTWKEQQKNGFEYYFFNNEDCDSFIKENFDGNVYQAYNNLPMGVMKADLWRYCIIYINGGIYADSDTICKVNANEIINNNKGLLLVVPENGTTFFCQWVFAAPPKSPILKKIIDNVVSQIENMENIRKNVKPDDIIHEVTGPSIYTKSILDYLQEEKLPIYKDLSKYISTSNTSVKELNVPEPTQFHKDIVVHLFAGDEGWKVEKKNIF